MSASSKPHFSGAFDRLLYLRTLPLFGTLPPEDLALVATYTTERQFAPGAVLASGGGTVDSIHLIVDGDVRTSRGGTPIGVFGPRDAVGVLGLLARADEGVEAVTMTETRTLEIGADALLDLFEDHFAILEHVLRGVAARRLEKERSALLAGVPDPARDSGISPARPLDFVERIFFLRRALPRGFSSVAALAGIARRATELRCEAGTLLWSQGDPADAVVIPVNGSIACVVDGGSHRFRFGPGAFVAASVALAGAPHWYEARADSALLALQVPIEGLIEVFDDHFELAMEMLALMARDLLDIVPVEPTVTDPRQGLAAANVDEPDPDPA